jgi:uncharacterized protein YjbI with pentapeptide repeats
MRLAAGPRLLAQIAGLAMVSANHDQRRFEGDPEDLDALLSASADGSPESWEEWRASRRRIRAGATRPKNASGHLWSADLAGANLAHLDLAGFNLGAANLYCATLTGAKLGSSNLAFCQMTDARLDYADFRRADIRGADVSGSYMFSCNLSESLLRRTNLRGANLGQAVAVKATFAEADVRSADLWKANLRHSDLTNTDLRHAHLVGADLTLANMTGAKLYGTALHDWVLEGVECGYVFVDLACETRVPRDRFFGKGEFERLMTRGRPVLDILRDALREPVAVDKHVFVSYVREDLAAVTRLANALEEVGIAVWLDRTRLVVGVDWKKAIRQAIRAGAFFIACFSSHYWRREESYMNDELLTAIESMRRMHSDRRWFLPVRIDDCAVPDLDIGGGKTLRDLCWLDLFDDWEGGVEQLKRTIASG